MVNDNEELVIFKGCQSLMHECKFLKLKLPQLVFCLAFGTAINVEMKLYINHAKLQLSQAEIHHNCANIGIPKTGPKMAIHRIE